LTDGLVLAIFHAVILSIIIDSASSICCLRFDNTCVVFVLLAIDSAIIAVIDDATAVVTVNAPVKAPAFIILSFLCCYLFPSAVNPALWSVRLLVRKPLDRRRFGIAPFVTLSLLGFNVNVSSPVLASIFLYLYNFIYFSIYEYLPLAKGAAGIVARTLDGSPFFTVADKTYALEPILTHEPFSLNFDHTPPPKSTPSPQKIKIPSESHTWRQIIYKIFLTRSQTLDTKFKIISKFFYIGLQDLATDSRRFPFGKNGGLFRVLSLKSLFSY
jgi:hypothetical protein